MLKRLSTAIAIAGALLMLAAAGMVVVSVSVRNLTDVTMMGDYEIVQMVTAVAAFAFLPLCQMRRGNILVDTFTARLPDVVQRGLDALWDLVYAGIIAIVAWQLMQGAIGTVKSNTVSMILALPVGWAIGLCAVLAAFLAVISVATAWTRLKGDPA